METIFYIIAIIIIVLRAVYQNKKKTQKAQKTVISESPLEEVWKEIMEDEKTIEQSIKEEPDIVEKPIGEIENIPFSEYKIKSQEEISEVGTFSKKAPIKTFSKKKKIKIDGDDFSMKKAIIYSEIMNRKYV